MESDNRLLADGVRVLARTVGRARQVVKQVVQEPFADFTAAAKALSRQIGETLRKKTEAAKNVGRQQYQELLAMTQKKVETARQMQKQLSQAGAKNDSSVKKLPRTKLAKTQIRKRGFKSLWIPG